MSNFFTDCKIRYFATLCCTFMKYWTNEPKILAVGTSLTDQSLSEDLFREMCPSVRLTKIELFSISSSDGKVCPEKSISEKLKLEVLSGNYDIVTVETGVNEISNFKKKPKDFVETIAFRLMELNFIIKVFHNCKLFKFFNYFISISEVIHNPYPSKGKAAKQKKNVSIRALPELANPPPTPQFGQLYRLFPPSRPLTRLFP